jgi:hypothetical protein
MKHKCPRCGKETEGSFSAGGIKWAICEDCQEAELLEWEASEQQAQAYIDYKYQHEEEAAARNEK